MEAPYYDTFDELIPCVIGGADDFCPLHLNSQYYSNFGPVYSVESAVGLIIGTGNVGN